MSLRGKCTNDEYPKVEEVQYLELELNIYLTDTTSLTIFIFLFLGRPILLAMRRLLSQSPLLVLVQI